MRLLRDSDTQRQTGDLLAAHLAGANLLGRLQIVRHVYERSGRKTGVSPLSHLVTNVRFSDDQDDADASAGFSLDLPPDQVSIDYIRNLTPVTKLVFDGLTSQYKKLAFTMAGVADQELLKKIRDALAEALQSGETSADFTAAVNKLTDEAGIERLTAWTIDNAFNNAMQSAYSLGRLEQMSSPGAMAALPVWQYWTVGDDRVRPEHAVLQSFAAQAIDPVWRRIYPPSGYNCRCAVVPILASEAPPDAMEPGTPRLPILALLKVPQPGFSGIFNAA